MLEEPLLVMAVPQLGDPGAAGSPSPVQHIALLQLDHCCLAMLVIAWVVGLLRF